MTALDFASAVEAAQAIRSGRIGARELTQRILDRIHLHNPKLGAVVNDLADQAIAEAATIDADRSGRQTGGPLRGVPILVKDAFEIAGVPTTGGVKQLQGYRPAIDSEVVRRLRAAGAIVLGNTNVPLALNDWQSYNDIYAEVADFAELKRVLEATQGNLGANLVTLEQAGYITIEKSFVGGKPLTRARITRQGREAVRRYLLQMAALVESGLKKR